MDGGNVEARAITTEKEWQMKGKSTPAPQEGDKRQRTFFALLPVSDGVEWRWLETVTVIEEYSWMTSGDPEGVFVWEITDFVDKESKS